MDKEPDWLPPGAAKPTSKSGNKSPEFLGYSIWEWVIPAVIGVVFLIWFYGRESGPVEVDLTIESHGTCRRAIADQFVGVSSVIVKGVNETDNGMLVHMSATLTGGTQTNLNCWTKKDGSLDEIRLAE